MEEGLIKFRQTSGPEKGHSLRSFEGGRCLSQEEGKISMEATFPLMSDADSRWTILPTGDWNLATTEGAQQRSGLRAARCRGPRLAFVIRQTWIQIVSSLCLSALPEALHLSKLGFFISKFLANWIVTNIQCSQVCKMPSILTDMKRYSINVSDADVADNGDSDDENNKRQRAAS